MRTMLVVAMTVLMATGTAGAQQQIVNGGFETGNFTGWNVAVQPGSNGNFFTTGASTTPTSGFTTNGPRSGRFYAVTDQQGPGAYELWQSFTITGAVTNAVFSFSIAVLNSASATANFGDLNHTSSPNQHVRVDLFSGAYSPFGTASLQNFFAGSQTELGGTTYVDFSVDVTSLLNAPGTYTVRFAEVDNQLYQNLSVDDVSLVTTSTPEPASMTLLATGLIGMIGFARRRRRTE